MSTPTRIALRNNLILGVSLVAALTVGVGGWAATTHFAGAVVAPGQLIVETNVKKVQHPTGGVVGELAVREGDKVEAGAIVVKLDDTLPRANVSIARKSLAELYARRARLAAERDGQTAMPDPVEMRGNRADPDLELSVANERKLFEMRRTARLGQIEQLRQRTGQLKQEISGQSAVRDARNKELALIVEELAGVQALYDKNLVQLTRLISLRREEARLNGERAQLASSIAQINGRILEIEMQIGQIASDLASEVARDMKETDARIAEMVERLVAAEDSLKRVDIRAPQSGFVHQLAVHTIGGVVGPSEQLMVVVPVADMLAIEAKISPAEIDRLFVGQTAGLRFSALNARTTPEIEGKITIISADVSTDQRSGASFYTVRILAPPDQIARLGDVRLTPGMPVEAFIKTDERTVFSYLTKPLGDQIARAFRER